MEHDFEAGLILATQQNLLVELNASNAYSAHFGLTLSPRAMLNLAEKRREALFDQGRVEIGASAITALIEGFCDSPFLLQDDYEATMLELVEAFYYFKNAAADQLADDELIAAMRARYDAFDGSVEAVVGTTMEALCRAKRFGTAFVEETVEQPNDALDEEDAIDDE